MCFRVTFSSAPDSELEYQPLNVEIRPSDESRLIPHDGTPQQGARHNDHGPSFVWALAKSFGGTFLIAGVFKFGQDLLGFASPQILKYVTTTSVFLLH